MRRRNLRKVTGMYERSAMKYKRPLDMATGAMQRKTRNMKHETLHLGLEC